MENVIRGNNKKKYADLYVKGKHIGRVYYYYWSENDELIRLHDQNKYVIAQLFKDKVVVIFNREKIEDESQMTGE